MKYALEMGLGAMIYIPSFIKISSRIEKLIKRRGEQSKLQALESVKKREEET
jgi:hypothetical protein